jgi:dynein light chain 1
MGEKKSGGVSTKEALEHWKSLSPENDPATSEKVSLICHIPSITKMDSQLGALKACTHLSLSTNAISAINLAQGLSNLKILSLGRNKITQIKKLEDVKTTLEELWISYNYITKLDGLGQMQALRVLYISNNQIEQFDELLKLRDCPLEELLLLGNPCYERYNEDFEQHQQRRCFVLQRLPNLKKLDGDFVKASEREMAQQLLSEGITGNS